MKGKRYGVVCAILLCSLWRCQPSRTTTTEGGALGATEDETVLELLVERDAVTSDLVDYVAEVGAPEVVLVETGETLRDVLWLHCGQVHDRYVEILFESLSDTSLALDLDAPVHATQTIELPACLWLPAYESEAITVAPNDTPWLYFRNDAAGFEAFRAPHGAERGGLPIDFMSYFEELNPEFTNTRVLAGPEVMVPRSGTFWSTLELAPNLELPVNQTVEGLTRRLAEGGQLAGTIGHATADKIGLIAQLTDAELASFNSCNSTPEGDAASFDVVVLTQVLAHNIAVLANDHHSPERVTVVLPDTGVFRRVEAPPFPTHRIDRVDPDNLIVQFDQRPFDAYEKRHHGTYVATVALGGPRFMRVLDALGIDIRIAPMNFLKETGVPPRYSVRAESFNSAVRVSLRKKAILNLSVGRSQEFISLQDQLDKDSPILFVVAAGNDGRPLAERRTYPARYGGANNDGRYNLITVAALDLDGTRAGFSNHGARYVDIAAPGCRRPVLEYDPQSDQFFVRQASGTSFSAPMVSFTAALLKAFWLDATPGALKRRILSASDISPLLDENEVADQRVLNISKALSLFQDVVEAQVDGERLTVRGRIEQELFTYCGGAVSAYRDHRTNASTMKKLARIPGDPPQFLIYYTTPDDVLEREECPVDGPPITITNHFLNRTYEIPPQSIVDVVFAERKPRL